MALVEEHPGLAPATRQVLSRLRWRIRGYVLLYGLAAILLTLGLAFWGSLLIDWLLEPTPAGRIAVLTIVGGACVYLLIRMILLRVFAPLSDRSMALLIERKYPDLDDGLLTAVELSGLPAGAAAHREMLAHTTETVQRRAALLDLDRLFNPTPLTRSIVTALLLAVSIVCFAAALPDMFGLWYRRTLLLAEESWPRHTLLLVEGFDEQGVKKVARGGDVPVMVKADTQKVVPRSVEIRYRTDDGARGRELMTREGVAVAGEDDYQLFAHTFGGVLTSRSFDVVGGDARVRGLRIEVVDSPTISQIELYCEYPAYTGIAPREITVSGAMRLPEGTRVTVRAAANKPLELVEVDFPVDSETFATDVLPMADFDDPTRFEFTIDSLDADKTLLFRLLDTDGITNRDPVRLALAATADEAPQVAVRTEGIGTAVTPQARIPLSGAVNDDYGVRSVWYEYAVGDAAPARRILFQHPSDDAADEPDGTRAPVELTIQEDQAFEVRGLELQPGQKLLLAVRSSDNYALAEKPNESSSERFLLDVVSADELRRMLEARELNLRRRFESIIDEVADTRDSLGRIDLLGSQPAADAAEPDAEGSDSGEILDGPRISSTELRRLRVERALQASRKNAGETLGVAHSFADIRAELDNNRIDSEELKERIQVGIADPLIRVGEEMFPEFDRLLGELRDQLDDDSQGRTTALAALRQSDAILAEMQKALAKMIELEDLSEVLALLREIIEDEVEIHRLTKEHQAQKALELLEGD